MEEEYRSADIAVLNNLPPVRKRGRTIGGDIERPDLWQLAEDKNYVVEPGQYKSNLVSAEYLRLLSEAEDS